MDTTTAALITEQLDLESDLAKVRDFGPDQLDVVAFADLRDMGAPLNLSRTLRHRIHNLVAIELEARLERLHRQLHGPELRVAQ